MTNLVDIVGYQFERTHTGVISWLLDSRAKSTTMGEKYKILQNLYKAAGKTISFKKNDISSVNCIKEYSFGRRRKIDLVIEVDIVGQDKVYFAIEMKIDSVPYEEQLKNTAELFSKQYVGKDVNYFLFLLGASQVSILPLNLHGFVVLTLDDIHKVFANLLNNNYVYKDWISALSAEQERKIKVMAYLQNAKNIWEREYFEGFGYRTWIPFLFYVLNQLNSELQLTKYKKWNIYSGFNNAVLNWEGAWDYRTFKNVNMAYLWEFNNYDLCLKSHIENHHQDISYDDLYFLRESISLICKNTSYQGEPTKNRRGEHITLYKWRFDFQKTSIKDIARHVEDIITHVHPQIR